MATDDPARAFAEAYADIYHRFHRRVPPGTYRPSREALAVLRHLRDSGPLTVGEAGEHFARSQAAMSEIVNRLEARSLLARIQDERDKRRHLVWLTPVGLELLAREGQVLSVELVKHAIAQMSASDAQKLSDGLSALLGTIASASADPPKPTNQTATPTCEGEPEND